MAASFSPMEGTNHWRALFGLLTPHGGRVTLMAAVVALAGLLPLAGPLLIAAFIDEAADGATQSRLLFIAGVYVAVGVARQLLSVLVAWTSTDLAWTVTNELRSTLTRHVLGLDLSFHRSTSPGELVSRVDGDVTALSEFISNFLARAAAAVFTLLGLLVIVTWRSWPVGIAMALYLAAALAGTAYLLFQYTQVLRSPLDRLADETERVQRAAGGMSRTLELLAEETAIADRGRTHLPDGALGVQLDEVCFEYADEDDPQRVVDHVSLELAPGRTLGVLGRTGSGKTTLARLLLRLVEPTAGQIRFGGVAQPDIAIAEFRARAGVVSQDVHLFGASIRDNLTLFDGSITDGQVRAALADLDLLDWVENMPNGLDTELGPSGDGLSGGEGQLIALTRLFLRAPDFVLLDEASSRIDPDTEARVTHAIDRLLDGRTAVVIAHRLSTVERLDEILVLDGGRIAEHGPTEALRSDPDSRYSQLIAVGATQSLDEILDDGAVG